jgi:molybdate transport system substrate-binding protein
MMRLIVIGTSLLLAINASGQKREVNVAAAANLSEVFQQVGPQFELATGIHPVFSFGSTAQLATQIENGAPFDVFAAADVDHVKQLVQKGLMPPGSWALYATGILALWSPPGSKVQINQLQDLTQPSVKVIALAKPELAPYGLAARETLQKQGIWNQVESKIVYADNITMAKQYGSSGNADAVFTAYSLVLKEPGKVIRIDEKLHAPIDQAVGIVAASKKQAEGRDFINFLTAGKGRDIMRDSGYKVPAQKPFAELPSLR